MDLKKVKFPKGIDTSFIDNVRVRVRDYFDEHRNSPTVYETCSITGLSLDDLHELFPDGYRRGACRMAGLPFFA